MLAGSFEVNKQVPNTKVGQGRRSGAKASRSDRSEAENLDRQPRKTLVSDPKTTFSDLPTGEGSSLGTITRFASPSHRAKRFTRQTLASDLLPKERIKACMRYIRPVEGGGGGVKVWYSPEHAKAHYEGLMVCGSVWGCPVCAAKITEKRRVELAAGISRWPGSIFMASFTLQHSRADKTADLRDHLNKAYRAIKSGKSWITFENKFQIAGSIRSFEITYSLENGPHPHLHVLFFSSLPAGQLDAAAIQEYLYRRFSSMLAKEGRFAAAQYGVKVEMAVDAQGQGDQALKKYISKWGLEAELTKSPVKNARDENGIKHYSPFQLLDLYGSGHKWAGALFQEYYFAMKGSKQLVYSRGLKKLLGLQAEDKTDQELAEEHVEKGEVLLGALSPVQWHIVRAQDARAELLEVADSGDVAKLSLFLAQLGITWRPPQLASVDPDGGAPVEFYRREVIPNDQNQYTWQEGGSPA